MKDGVRIDLTRSGKWNARWKVTSLRKNGKDLAECKPRASGLLYGTKSEPASLDEALKQALSWGKGVLKLAQKAESEGAQ